MSVPLLDIRDLSVSLPPGGDRPLAVENVSLAIRQSEILCVVGESGSGKSMMAHAILGLLPKNLRPSGAVAFEGRNLLALGDRERRAMRGSRIGMIFQEPMAALNPVMRIGDQIGELFRFHGRSDPTGARTLELLRSVGLPEPDLIRHAYPFRLSGGQRQRVMIAMALALDPALLIADEPTTALDVTTQAQILALLKDIRDKRETAIMLITHDFGVVADMADTVAVMQRGQVVETGRASQLLQAPQHPYTSSLLAAVPKLSPRPPREIAREQVLTAANVTKRYAARRGLFRPARSVLAVADATFSLARGETLGVVGESGSGKSTLARILVRLLDADAGEVRLAGLEGNMLALLRTELRPVRRRIQMVFQDPFGSLNPRRTVFEIVAQGLLAHGVHRATAQARVDKLLSLVALDPSAAERYPNEFSGGQRQRIGIARALALEPEILIADEPVSALDVSVQAQVLRLLGDVQERLKLSMVFITHDLRVAAQVCDRVAVMHQGAIVEIGPASEVLFDPKHEYTRLLINSIPGLGRMPGTDEPAAHPRRRQECR